MAIDVRTSMTRKADELARRRTKRLVCGECQTGLHVAAIGRAPDGGEPSGLIKAVLSSSWGLSSVEASSLETFNLKVAKRRFFCRMNEFKIHVRFPVPVHAKGLFQSEVPGRTIIVLL